MPTSYAPVYLHLIWTTKRREPTIPLEYEREMYRVMRAEAKRMKGKVIAANGTADHVHLLVDFGRFVSISRFVNQTKGVSSAFLNSKCGGKDGSATPFRWQEGYGIFSVGQNQIKPVVTYIDQQRQRHAAGNLWSAWEASAGDDT